MIYSKPCEYAIRALSNLASAKDGTARADEIAAAENLPAPVLSKILQELVRKGLLKSRRGPGGGFQLARGAELITLRDVVAATDGLDQFQDCAVGLERCSDDSPCPLHDQWKDLRAGFLQYLQDTTLDVMARTVKRKKELLRDLKKTSRT
ncbi:MAG: Rrf2 family transcriptional regulator [Acidobacteriia bacterium]|nr:Rrf2 family transcriptional regulator [Terriglobia bacterium]